MANIGGLDSNSRRTLSALSNADNTTIVNLWADPTTHRLLVDLPSGAGITSINADTTADQLLAVGTSGTDFAIVDAGAGLHTFNLPSASATARGVVTTGTQTLAGAKTFSTAPILSSLTVSQILALDGSGNIQSLATATYPSLTELSYVKGVTSAIQTQLNSKGAGTVTTVSVATANGFSGTVANATTTPAITIIAGAITPTTVNGLTITANGTNTLNISAGKTVVHTAGTTFAGTDGKTLTVSNSLTLAGTDSTVMTFPTTSATIARTDAANTFTGVQTMTSPVLNTSTQTPLVIGGTGTTSTLLLRSTSGSGTTGADVVIQTGANGGTEVGRFYNSGIVTTALQSGARAYRNTSVQSIPGSFAQTKIQFNAENWDIQGEFDPVTNYRFTAVAAGIYQVTLSVRSQPANATAIGASIYVNNSQFAYSQYYVGSAGQDAVITCSSAVQLAAGGYIEGYFAQSNAGAIDVINDSGATYLSIQKVA